MNMSGTIKTYTELIRLQTFQERFEYLKLDGSVGIETFGFDRYLNQIFYNSKEWKRLRNEIIVRDKGCDLACDGYEIQGNIIIHHMNPITPEARQKQMISLATDCAEDLMRSGKAPSQIIV